MLAVEALGPTCLRAFMQVSNMAVLLQTVPFKCLRIKLSQADQHSLTSTRLLVR